MGRIADITKDTLYDPVDVRNRGKEEKPIEVSVEVDQSSKANQLSKKVIQSVSYNELKDEIDVQTPSSSFVVEDQTKVAPDVLPLSAIISAMQPGSNSTPTAGAAAV